MYTPPKSYEIHEHVECAWLISTQNLTHLTEEDRKSGFFESLSMFSVFWRYFWQSHSMFDLNYKTNLGRLVQPFLDLNKLYYFTLRGLR